MIDVIHSSKQESIIGLHKGNKLAKEEDSFNITFELLMFHNMMGFKLF